MLRLALICDFLEEKWPSMDLVGDMLFEELGGNKYREVVAVEQMRPALNRRLTALPMAGKTHLASIGDRITNRVFDYPRWLRRRSNRHDIYHLVDHSYAHMVKELPEARTVVTCHDLDAFKCLFAPDLEPRPWWFKVLASRILSGLEAAAHVIFVSQHVRDEAVRLGIVKTDRISVIPNGVHSTYQPLPRPDADSIVKDFIRDSEGSPLLLHVGSTAPRKRIDLLLQIFAAARKQMNTAKLLRVGGELTPEQQQMAEQLGVAQHIVTLPFVSRDVLAAVYRKASMLLLPSEAEGFGLPLIEAMACGCPVISSDIPVFREVGKDAAVYCGVGDIEAWTNEISRLYDGQASNSAEWWTGTVSILQHAQLFSWAAAADGLFQIYSRLARV